MSSNTKQKYAEKPSSENLIAQLSMRLWHMEEALSEQVAEIEALRASCAELNIENTYLKNLYTEIKAENTKINHSIILVCKTIAAINGRRPE